MDNVNINKFYKTIKVYNSAYTLNFLKNTDGYQDKIQVKETIPEH